MLDKIAIFIATGFYSGLCPKAPGTAGTVAAAVLTLVAYSCCPEVAHPLSILAITIFTFILGVFTSARTLDSNFFGPDTKDPGQIVIDEFAGFFLTLLGVGTSVTDILIAFVFFRIFDILKPPPIRLLEKLPAAIGIMIDDIMAGIYAAVCAHLLLSYL